jgi:hypothetical protein
MSDDEFKDCEDGDADEFQDQPEAGTPTSNLGDEEQSKFIQLIVSNFHLLHNVLSNTNCLVLLSI